MCKNVASGVIIGQGIAVANSIIYMIESGALVSLLIVTKPLH